MLYPDPRAEALSNLGSLPRERKKLVYFFIQKSKQTLIGKNLKTNFRAHEEWGYCQAGTSALLSDDQVWLEFKSWTNKCKGKIKFFLIFE